ncbi:MAG: MFS transporter [Spirochaetales bacterium]|nr:MFS transporter [Spirochaetales bacterium]
MSDPIYPASEDTARRYLKRNFTLNVFDGISWFTGMIFLSPESILPVFLDRLGAAPFLISLIPVFKNLGVFFPSIFVARRLQKLKRKKKWIIFMGLAQRLPWFLCGLFCLFYAGESPGAAAAFILAALFVTSVAGGLNIPAFMYFTAKTIPTDLRGRLFAVRNLLSYILGFVCGGVIKWLMEALPSPENFAVLMLIGTTILMLYLPAFIFAKEPDAKAHHAQTKGNREFFRYLGSLLASSPNLRRYILGRIFFTVAFVSYNYFPVFLIRTYDLPESAVGLFAIITAAVFVVANPVLGIVSDKKGHLINHVLGSLALIAANLIAIFSQVLWLSYLTIALGAFVLCVQNVSLFALPMEFGEEHEIPVYVGLVGLFVGVASLLILVLGGVLELFGYTALFYTSLGASLVSVLLYATTVEPRGRKAVAIRDV